MTISSRHCVTVPISISYEPETGKIILERPSDPPFKAHVPLVAEDGASHEHLYYSLLSVLVEAGVSRKRYELSELN